MTSKSKAYKKDLGNKDYHDNYDGIKWGKCKDCKKCKCKKKDKDNK